MIAVKGLYDGERIALLDPLPKKQVGKKSLVVITFLEEEKVPRSTKQAVKELVANKLLDLDEVLNEI
ncbi:MAG: hypothetical protein ACREOI_03860 [bacterium]